MKHKLFSLLVLLCAATGLQAQSLAATLVEDIPGKQWTLTLTLQDAASYTALQTHLALPGGITPGLPVLGALGTGSHQAVCGTLADGTGSLVVYSSASAAFAAQTGTLVTLTLTVSQPLNPGTYALTLTNARLANAEGTEMRLADVPLTLLSTYDPSVGVSAIGADGASLPVYTLQGVRLQRVTRPGLYLRGGKKVYLK